VLTTFGSASGAAELLRVGNSTTPGRILSVVFKWQHPQQCEYKILYVNQSGYYSVQIADSNFCTALSDDVYVVYSACSGLSATETSIDEVWFSAEAKNLWSVHKTDPYAITNIHVYNMAGQLIQQMTQSSIIDLRLVPAGVYICVVEDAAGKLLFRKLCVQ
jgi:hypothetical protein